MALCSTDKIVLCTCLFLCTVYNIKPFTLLLYEMFLGNICAKLPYLKRLVRYTGNKNTRDMWRKSQTTISATVGLTPEMPVCQTSGSSFHSIVQVRIFLQIAQKILPWRFCLQVRWRLILSIFFWAIYFHRFSYQNNRMLARICYQCLVSMILKQVWYSLRNQNI